MSARREMALVLGAMALGALLALVAAGQPRVTLGLAGEQVTGARTPAGNALALVALAGAGAVILARSWLRVAIGLLLLACGVGVVVAFTRSVDGWSLGVTAFTPSGALPKAHRSSWAWLGAGGGVLIGLAALGVVLRGRRWPAPRRRFDAPSPAAADRPRDPWDALDRGEDPTV